MKKLLLLFSSILVFTVSGQNGFTTYTTNLIITSGVKNQTAFLLDNTGNKWIGFKTISVTPNIGLVKYDNTTWTLYNTTSSPALPSNNVTALAKDNSGNIWIGTDVGLVKFNGTTFLTYNTTNGLPSNTITSVETNGSQVYVGTRLGLSRFDGTTFTNYNVASSTLPNDTITSIKAENTNTIWLGGNNRLVKFTINNALTTTSYVNSLITPATGAINCIYIDAQNTKWLGTNTVGVLKYNGMVFQNANSLYEIFGGAIPNKVVDIEEGLNNGVIFKMTSMSTSNASTGIIELAPNNKVYQYFNFLSIGDYIQKSVAGLLISQGGPNLPYSGNKMYYAFDKINYVAPLGVVSSNNFKTLDINNVRAGIANRGDMHWDIGGSQTGLYEVPKGSGKNSNFASALWIGGLDNAGQLHGGAQTYRQSGVDFWPGPLDVFTASTNTTTATNYDKIWKVSYNDIDIFINAYNNGSVVATPDMLTWPGNGDVNLNQASQLAPYVDVNGDNLYNPNDGDYPNIKGDQALYFIYNDKLATHATSLTPMGIEVHGMAYAYGCSTSVNGKPELTYTTFYDYKIINRSSTSYHDVYVTMFSDVDLGNYNDDYIGSDVSNNYGYAYNGDSFDEDFGGAIGYGSYPPAQGFSILKGPIANTNDGIDNDNDGTVDEVGEECKLNKFNYFNNNLPGVIPETKDPTNATEYYNYMRGFWKDGTPLKCGGTGYGGITNASWAFTGDPNNNGVNTDPANTCGYWTQATGTITPGDRRMLLSSGPFNIQPGQVTEVEYAFVTSFDSTSAINANLLSVAKLKTDIQKINTFYNLQNKPNCLQNITTSVKDVAKTEDVGLYPNPSKSVLTIQAKIESNTKMSYEVFDVIGKKVLENESTTNQFTINVSNLNSGIYFIRFKINNNVLTKRFVKE